MICLSCTRLIASPGSSWMKGIADDKEIVELSILGTHNSCALHGGVYGACQSLDLKAQLELGVRFLDMRCQLRDGDFHMVHGITDQKMRFSEVVNICQDFLKENPSEMLLMSIMEQRSKNRKNGDFAKTFKRIIKNGEAEAIWYQQKKLPTIGAGRGKIVIVSRNKELVGVPWSAFRIQDEFRINSKQSIDQKWQSVVQHFKGVKISKKPSISFVSCTGIFSPPRTAAKKLNQKLKVFLTNKQERPSGSLGIVVVDFVTAEMFHAVHGQ